MLRCLMVVQTQLTTYLIHMKDGIENVREDVRYVKKFPHHPESNISGFLYFRLWSSSIILKHSKDKKSLRIKSLMRITQIMKLESLNSRLNLQLIIVSLRLSTLLMTFVIHITIPTQKHANVYNKV